MRRFYMSRNHGDAPGRWSIVDNQTGELIADYATEIEALRDLVERSPVFADGEASVQSWEGPIGFEDTETSDGRFIREGALSFRDLPLPLMFQSETAWGHDGAVIAGRIDTLANDGGTINATGVFDTGEDGTEAARLVENETLNGVSMDLSVQEWEFEITEVDDEGFPVAGREVVVAGEVMGATITPFPAFADARIRVAASVRESVTAAGGPLLPNPDWYEDPGFAEVTPWTVHDDGEVFGHLALWGTCHIGRDDVCMTAPHSAAEYAYFTTGSVNCDEGCNIPVGVVTMSTGHAGLHLNHRGAAAHYDDNGTAVADIAVGEDKFGIWVHGSLRPNLTDEQVRQLRASSLSGDWRRIGGGLELVAALAVNVPGFPIPRARVASGEEMALVAAATPRQTFDNRMALGAAMGDGMVMGILKEMHSELAGVKKALRPLLELAASEVDKGVQF